MKAIIFMMLLFIFACMGCAGTRSAAVPARKAHALVPAVSLMRVHFPTARANVVARDLDTLDRNAALMADEPGAVVVLEGHCDERGSEAFNLELGDRRARAVLEEMARRGVDPARFIIVSRGEAEPLVWDHDEVAWRRNRRVEFIVR